MFWKEDTDENTEYLVPDDVVDLVYNINCRCLPLDHAFAFSEAIRAQLPWIDDEPAAGVHLIHGAESGNGWMRPEDPDKELLHLSRRSRMTLRMPGHRVDDAQQLSGKRLDVAGHPLEVGKAKVKLLSTLPTQFARYVAIPGAVSADDEEAFMQYVVDEMRALNIPVRKLLCGLPHSIRHPDGDIRTRSIMLADLEVNQAITIQKHGVGRHKHIGCGLFMPHKGISAVHEMNRSKNS